MLWGEERKGVVGVTECMWGSRKGCCEVRVRRGCDYVWDVVCWGCGGDCVFGGTVGMCGMLGLCLWGWA